MTYIAELYKEFDQLRDKWPKFGQIRSKSNSAKLAKLRRYIARVRGEHVPNQKWLKKVFEGRPNRTPWKCKGLPYVLKAERLRLHAEAIKLFGH